MSGSLYTDLSWLPHVPADFAQRCKLIIGEHEDLGPSLRSLARCALDENQLIRLAGIAERSRREGKLGFARLAVVDDGSTTWELAVAGASAAGVPMEVRRIGFDIVPA